MSNEQPKRFTTVKEAARELDLSEVTIRRAIKRGEMPHVKVGDTYRIPVSAIQPTITSKKQD